MKWHDGRLDLLAVIASKPRTGQFREFIKQAKLISKTITVMIDDNPIVGPICARYGFRPVMETFPIINGTETANAGAGMLYECKIYPISDARWSQKDIFIDLPDELEPQLKPSRNAAAA